MKAAKYRADYYSRLAHRAGYRARSIYKLQEIDRRNRLVRPQHTLLDVGAAPGSWSQYCARMVGHHGLVVAVDKQRLIPPAGNVRCVTGDIQSHAVRQQLVRWQFDGLVCDIAPHTTGIREIDAARSAELTESVIDLMPRLLKQRAFAVMKIFASDEVPALVSRLNGIFRHVRLNKPRASRASSTEIYIVCTEHTNADGSM